MSETQVLAAVRQRVTIKRGEGGAWYVTIEGNGYPADFDVASVDLVKIRDAGYVIEDPHGWCDLYGPAELREPEVSLSAMDADSAGYPGELAGCGLSFDDADTFGEIEAAYREIEESYRSYSMTRAPWCDGKQ